MRTRPSGVFATTTISTRNEVGYTVAKHWALTLLGLLSPSLAFASDLDLRAESGGLTSIEARPGEVISYSIVGELSDNLNEGLALFLVDLSFEGGPLSAADTPGSAPLDEFATPKGVNNPAGFGGTADGSGGLLQVGGGQNTILNTFGSFPTSLTVATGVAANGSPSTLVTGQLTAPTQFGTYRLQIMNPVANVIRQGETGSPFWAVDAVPAFTTTDLEINVISLRADISTMSLAAGGTQNFMLDGGDVNAGRLAWLISNITGTSPGVTTSSLGLVLPLNSDPLFTYLTMTDPSPPQWQGNITFLDPSGMETAAFVLGPGEATGLAGMTIHHAFVVIGGPDVILTSNAVPLALTL